MYFIRVTQYTTEFYNRLNEINQAYADIQDARKMGDIDEARKLIDENRDILATRKFYKKHARDLSKIGKRMKLIKISSMSPLEKRNEMDRLTKMKNFLTEQIHNYEEN